MTLLPTLDVLSPSSWEALIPIFVAQAWPLMLAAFIAGLVDSMGGGGGLITVPTLLTMGVPAPLILGTNKCLSTIGSLPAVFRYARAGLLPVLGRGMLLPLFLCASCIAAYAASLSQEPLLLEHLHLFIPLLLLAVMAFMLKRWFWDEPRRLRAAPMAQGLQLDFESKLRQPQAFFPLMGIAAYDGLLGPGTGTFFMTLFERVGLPTLNANALTKIFNLASNLGAITFFALDGKVDWKLGISAAGFSLCGNYLGAGFVLKRGQKLVRAVVLIATLGLLLKHLYRLYA